MPRSIEITVPPEQAHLILRRIATLEGVLGFSRHHGASLRPAGDIVSVQTTNDATRQVVEVLDELDIARSASIMTNEPRSLLSPGRQRLLDRESNETIWDEMAFLLRQDTNLAPNYLALMALAGAIAAVGLWADTLHFVIGAMVIAPAFEPLVRMPFGLIIGPRHIAGGGALSSAAGFAMLAVGALAALLMLQAIDPGRSAGLQSRTWVQFWSTFTAPGILVSAFAAIAGALVISSLRSVLTTGVMIALALIPSMAIVGMTIGVGDFALAGRGLLRWAVDAMLVLVLSAIVLVVKRLYLRHHRALS